MPKLIPFALAVICMTSYAFIIVELKPLARQYNIIVLAASYLPLQVAITGVALGVVWLSNSYRGVPLTFPSGSGWWIILAFAAAYFVAQNLNTGVYAAGGTPEMMAYMTLLIPLLVPLMSYFLNGARLNVWHAGAFVAAVVMIAFSIKASAT